jgi:3-methyladenine DNA glycosylase/8-oxoguanine DNA glycosylase
MTDADATAALRAADPTLGRLIDAVGPIDLTSWRSRWSLDPFRSLARAIVGQQDRRRGCPCDLRAARVVRRRP